MSPLADQSANTMRAPVTALYAASRCLRSTFTSLMAGLRVTHCRHHRRSYREPAAKMADTAMRGRLALGFALCIGRGMRYLADGYSHRLALLVRSTSLCFSHTYSPPRCGWLVSVIATWIELPL